jgi:tRNA pseudouridine32 synthase / 23S rRNA pseudouridine746 synthase
MFVCLFLPITHERTTLWMCMFQQKQELNVLFEDDHLIAVAKPSGVLSVSDVHPNLAQAVFDNFVTTTATSKEMMDRADKMVVHRLGMDTSGVLLLAKTNVALRGMNAAFRARRVERTYEALLCGHVAQDKGMISLPLMRDYQFPPFMRVSTEQHQKALIGLEAADVGKKLLAAPKESLTMYQVVSREEFQGHPVTRLTLTSISGRTHQLNVHMAAFGHPIVGDSTYGLGGDAAPNGGLSVDEQDTLAPNSSRASVESQKALATAKSCVHAKSLKFRHPVTKKEVSITMEAPF